MTWGTWDGLTADTGESVGRMLTRTQRDVRFDVVEKNCQPAEH